MNENTLNLAQEQRIASLLVEAKFHKHEASTLYSDVSVALLYYDQLARVDHRVRARLTGRDDIESILTQVNRQVEEKVYQYCRMFWERERMLSANIEVQSNEILVATENMLQIELQKGSRILKLIEEATEVITFSRDMLDRIKASIYILCSYQKKSFNKEAYNEMV